MSIHVPEKGWFRAPAGAERLWIGLALVWCIIMFLMMPYWHFKGKQNSTGEAYRVTNEAFVERVEQFVTSYTVGEVVVSETTNADGETVQTTVPIVEPPPGGEAYLWGKMWAWYPVLQLREGQEYRIHVSSTDLQHGLSILPLNMNFQILPGYDHVLTIRPTSSGEFPIICNEFCGIGHHLMTGRIIVVPAEVAENDNE